jgi:putative lipoic acid-binding regulatory protein
MAIARNPPTDYTHGYFGEEPDEPTFTYKVVGDRVEEMREVVVHTFSMGDVEDPDLYAAEPLYQWQESAEGKWIMEHAVETPCWHRMHDQLNYGYQYSITAKLRGPRLTEWLLIKK